MSAPDVPGSPRVEDPSTLAGEADGFERLWTPHRMVYVGGTDPADGGEAQCPFCRAPTLPDAETLVLARGEHAYVVLNLYPYNPGHLLVCPYRHVASYVDATDGEVAEVASLTRSCLRVLAQAAAPHGFNVGINQGAVAGAGIAAHLHQHVVPRWGGDSNFLPVVARTKAVPELLDDTRARLARAWADSGEAGTASP